MDIEGSLPPQIVDELVRALMGRYPRAVLQFEDFNLEHALPLLDRYRDHHLVFNDDVQVSPVAQSPHSERVSSFCFNLYVRKVGCTYWVYATELGFG